ncbi:TorF family putative porin [Aquabacterium sp.]|uniref:TorF family putative porin n=1 Tax=Aquabacterium sp. TaxID=1872578 RepID=UPI003784F9F1
MKKSLLALSVALAAGAIPTASFADLAFNVGGVTEYRYRGISQSRLKPALQGGIDYSNGGFYLGAWASTIKWIKDAGGDGNVEIDVYGGYKGDIVKDSLSYDVGVLTYNYPSNKLKAITGAKADTVELYGALTFGPATVKYSHAVTDTFGNPDSKNSFYLEAGASFDVYDGWSLAPHIGYQKIKGPFEDPATYTDYSLTLSKDFKGLVPSIAIIGTDADKSFYVSPVNGKKLGTTKLVLGIKYNF